MIAFDEYRVGDEVYCLAWIGKKFEIVARDEDRGILSLQGGLENVPHGAQVDIFRSTTWMVTRQKWDQIWYWPDRAGETYEDVYRRFVKEHKAGEVLTGYQVEGPYPLEPVSFTAARAMAFRIMHVHDLGILIAPVVGLVDGAKEPLREAEKDPAVRWVMAGPPASAVLKMTAYRWSLTYGDIVLNWRDFEASAQKTN